MFKSLTLLIVLSLSLFTSCAQQTMADYIGDWEGKTANKEALNLDISIKKLKGDDAIFRLSNDKEIVAKNFKFSREINLVIDKNFTFKGIVNQEQSEINGFIQNKRNFYPAKLNKKGDIFIGKWNLSIIHYLQPESLRLSIKEVSGTGWEYQAYPTLGSLWCNDFKKENDVISFTDYFTGLKFEGRLKASEIILNIRLGNNLITKISYKKSTQHKKSTRALLSDYSQSNDGWKSSKKRLTLPKMEEGIHNDSLEGMEGVVIAKKGEIVYENYFVGFNANTPHTTRSAGKSFGSAMIGIAIDDKIINNVDQKLYEFIPKEYQYTKDTLKSKITIKHLLTMNSGLDVNKKAYENFYQQESSDNWLKTVLEAPMVHEPGTYADYGSANPFLLSVSLNERLDKPLEVYMDEKLFTPLGITNYILNTDDSGIPYFGGGLQVTPRDMLKFGQLYLNGGVWKGKQIVSEKWVEESFKKHSRLQDRNGNEYGYLWWHHTYSIEGKDIKTIEARGAGGQLICLIPQLETVAVVTAGNYRNRKGNQSREILRDYILPTIVK